MNVIAISGSEDLLRRRALQAAVQEQEQKGWRIVEIDGETPDSVGGALAQSGMLFIDQQTLIVVHNPEKANLSTIEGHLKGGDESQVLLLNLEDDPKGNTKFGKFVLSLGKNHRNFAKPDKPWKQEGVAEAFCVNEATRLGVKLSQGLAKAVISSVGTDLGILSFELLKMATLAQAEGATEVTPQQARRILAGISEGGVSQVIEALITRNPLKLVKALSKVERTYKKEDRGMLLTRAILSKLSFWFPIVKAREAGVSVKEAAEQSGVNAWFYENKLYPETLRWTTPELVHFVSVLAEIERVLVKGALDPWVFLKGKLLSVCAGVEPKKQDVVRLIEVSEKPPVSVPVISKPLPVSFVFSNDLEEVRTGLRAGVPIVLKSPYVLQDEGDWGICSVFGTQRMKEVTFYEKRGEKPRSQEKIFLDEAGGKYGEFCAYRYLSRVLSIPGVTEPDVSIHKREKKSWRSDLTATGYPAFQVKTAITGDRLAGGGFTIQSQGTGGGPDALIASYLKVSGSGPDWSTNTIKIKGFGSRGYQYMGVTTRNPLEYLVLVLFFNEKPLPRVALVGLIPWGYLISEKLLQPRRDRNPNKLGVYFNNVKTSLGLGDDFYIPEMDALVTLERSEG